VSIKILILNSLKFCIPLEEVFIKMTFWKSVLKVKLEKKIAYLMVGKE